MAGKRSLVRGGITLAVLAALAGAMVVAPAGAHVTSKFGHLKKHINQIAKKQANQVFNQGIGPATTPLEPKTSDIVAFQKDGKGTGTLADPQQINSLSITAPEAGFLVISGQVEFDNDDVVTLDPCLRPRVDGANVVTGAGTALNTTLAVGQAICTDAADTPDDSQVLAYTVVAPVGAGAHTVTQELVNIGSTTYDYFNAGLTAQFYHSGSISNAPVLRGGGRGEASEE